MIYPGTEETGRVRVMPGFTDGLRDQQLALERDVALHWQATGFAWERLPALVADCVARKVRAIAAISPRVVAAARAGTATIPIVAQDLETDPVAAGLIESLARPGGNVTGSFFDFPEFSAKWLELIGELVPGIGRIGVLWDPGTGGVQITAVRALAAARGLALVERELPDLTAAEPAFDAFAAARVQAVLMLSSPLIGPNGGVFARAALARRLPTVTMFPEFAEAGGLMAYGPDVVALYRPMGEMVARILKGAKPGELPIERPTRMRLLVNLATARTLGLSVPPALLARADGVIE